MVVFGMGLLNGANVLRQGNVYLPEDAWRIRCRYRRMFLVGSAEPWQDFDWRNGRFIDRKRNRTVLERGAGDQAGGGRAHRCLAGKQAPAPDQKDYEGV